MQDCLKLVSIVETFLVSILCLFLYNNLKGDLQKWISNWHEYFMSILPTWNLKNRCNELICMILGFRYMMFVCKFMIYCYQVFCRGLKYPQLWPSPHCNEPLDMSKEFAFDVIDGILTSLLYYMLIRVSVIFNFQHSQWFSCSPHSFSIVMTLIKNPSKLSAYTYLPNKVFIVKCSSAPHSLF